MPCPHTHAHLHTTKPPFAPAAENAQRAPVHATFVAPRPTGLAPLPMTTAAALPEEERRPNGFLRRLLARRRGGATKGDADLKAPLAEAIGTGVLTLAIAMMGSAAYGLSGAFCEVDGRASDNRRMMVGCNDSHDDACAVAWMIDGQAPARPWARP